MLEALAALPLLCCSLGLMFAIVRRWFGIGSQEVLARKMNVLQLGSTSIRDRYNMSSSVQSDGTATRSTLVGRWFRVGTTLVLRWYSVGTALVQCLFCVGTIAAGPRGAYARAEF